MKVFHSRDNLATGQRKRNGSVLLSAVIFMAILTIICVSFSQLTLQEKKSAVRSHLNFCLLNAAEAGLEDAIWSINENNWSSWESLGSGTARYKAPHLITIEDGTLASVHTLVQNLTGAPVIYSDASVTLSNGEVLSKQIRVTYERVSPGSAGVVSKGLIELKGQPTFDSYDSRKGPPHPTLNRGDKIIVGTISTAANSLRLAGKVDIFGYTGTGSSDPSYSGPNNKVLGIDSPAGVNIDQSRVYNDFTFEIPEVEEPDWSGAATELPPAKDGVITLGDPGGSVQKYKLDKLRLINNSVKIVGPTQVHLENGMTLGSKAFVEVGFAGQFDVYTPGDVKIAGQAILNKTNQPSNFKIFGTATETKGQYFDLAGQGMMEAVFYFPNGEANMSGQGDLAGAIVANEFYFTGQMAIHYDEALGSQIGNRPGISSWHELTNPKHVVDLTEYVKEVGITRKTDYLAQIK